MVLLTVNVGAYAIDAEFGPSRSAIVRQSDMTQFQGR